MPTLVNPAIMRATTRIFFFIDWHSLNRDDLTGAERIYSCSSRLWHRGCNCLRKVSEFIDGGEPTLNHFASSLISLCLLLSSASPQQSVPQTAEPSASAIKVEEKDARELAIQFTIRFTETQDLSPIIRELYFKDFIERYKSFKTKELNNRRVDLYFAPGLDYSSQLTVADSKDWEDFYVATNNFLLLGFISALGGHSADPAKIKPSDLYPSEVIELLDKNPLLTNMILRKKTAKSIATVGEMRSATATLAQAATIIRGKRRRPPKITNKQELVRIMMNDEFFKPRVEVLDESFFGFAKGTRILFIRTPLGLQLMLAKDGDRLRIFWTEIITD